MKSAFTLAILASLVTATGFAQSKGALHLSLGGALPIGSYGSKSLNDPKAGAASLGPIAEIGYAHPLQHSPWGLTINIRGRLNGIDDAILQQFKTSFPAYRWSGTNSSYKTIAALAGVYYDLKLPESPRLSLHFELDLGAAKCIIPDYTALGIFDTAGVATGFIEAKVSKVSTVTFSGVAKAGITYQLNKKLQLLANLDLWYAQPNYKHLTNTLFIVPQLAIPGVISLSNSLQPVQIIQATAPYKQPMNSLNLTVGIGVTL